VGLPGYGMTHAASDNSPNTQGAPVITNQGCGYDDLTVIFNDGSKVDFGPAYGYGAYVVTPSGNYPFACTQTLSNPWPRTFPPQTLRLTTTCQDATMPGITILTKSGNVETTCHL
jgi:hypothetical protein